jgi:acetylornithine deacetylase/succinyl-diaminopimelate desuccinylase-like protein
MQTPVIDFINTRHDTFIDELKTLLAIPSVSALPEHAGDVRRCAEWCRDELVRIGMQRAEINETPGHPIVYAEWLGAPGGKTVLFYGHYDVQPVDPIDLWQTPPFEATVRDGALFARGSADDKGQVFMHFKALEAYLKTVGALPVNFKILRRRADQRHGDVRARRAVDLLRVARAVVLPDRPAGIEH